MPPRSSRRRRAACATALLLALLAGCGRDSAPVLHGEPQGPYDLGLVLDPATPLAGRDTTLRFTLRTRRDQQPVQDLEIIHERRLHTFIVARDFGSFAHVHQEDSAPLTPSDLAAGTFTFAYRFPRAGSYQVLGEFTHRDRSWQQRFDLEVAGTAPAPVTLDTSREQQVGDYRGTLVMQPDPPRAGEEAAMRLRLERAGQPVTNLELLLGAEAHVAIWSLDGKQFAHTHSYTPAMAAMRAMMAAHGGDAAHLAMMRAASAAAPKLEFPGPEVPVRHTFEAVGRYVMFMQLAPGGVPLVLRFVVDVDAP